MRANLFLCCLIFFSTTEVFAMPPSEEGKVIFTSRCASCHNINKIIVGPALAGVDQRRSIDWIISFVQSSQTLIKSGDKNANALFTKFNNIPMPDHRDLSTDNIKGIVEYIKSQSSPSQKENVFRPERLHPPYLPIEISSYWFFGTLLLSIGLLTFTLLLFARVKEYQRNKMEGK